MERLIYFAPVLGICALLFAFYLTKKVGKQDAGTDRMKEIAAFIHEGARAFLTAEYKILVVFVAVLFVLIGIGIGNWVTAVCFLVGALFSTAAGYIGMNVATKANVRTAAAAKDSGMNKALSIAFSGGAVMGMCVVGFGLFVRIYTTPAPKSPKPTTHIPITAPPENAIDKALFMREQELSLLQNIRFLSFLLLYYLY